MKLVKSMKDPGSAITHLIGLIWSVIGGIPLLIKAAQKPAPIYLIACAIYLMGLILLYAASSAYHSFDICDKVNRRLKKFDHMMISVLIAGSYTPICLLVLEKPLGYFLLTVVWSFAVIGILIKAFWINCPKWFSSVLYIEFYFNKIDTFIFILLNCFV